MFDKEQKGYIRASQVGQILRTMGQAFEERDLKQLIKEFDSDGRHPSRSFFTDNSHP